MQFYHPGKKCGNFCLVCKNSIALYKNVETKTNVIEQLTNDTQRLTLKCEQLQDEVNILKDDLNITKLQLSESNQIKDNNSAEWSDSLPRENAKNPAVLLIGTSNVSKVDPDRISSRYKTDLREPATYY